MDRTVDSLGWARRKVRQRRCTPCSVQQRRVMCPHSQAWETFGMQQGCVPRRPVYSCAARNLGPEHHAPGCLRAQVLSTAPDVSAFEAMVSMSASGISALAVVSEAGRLIGNFSTSELRTIMADHFGSLVGSRSYSPSS